MSIELGRLEGDESEDEDDGEEESGLEMNEECLA